MEAVILLWVFFLLALSCIGIAAIVTIHIVTKELEINIEMDKHKEI